MLSGLRSTRHKGMVHGQFPYEHTKHYDLKTQAEQSNFKEFKEKVMKKKKFDYLTKL